jgi:hypothetical protein
MGLGGGGAQSHCCQVSANFLSQSYRKVSMNKDENFAANFYDNHSKITARSPQNPWLCTRTVQ